MEDAAFLGELPLLGDSLKSSDDMIVGFFKDLSADVVAELTNLSSSVAFSGPLNGSWKPTGGLIANNITAAIVQQALFNTLGPAGLNILGENDGVGGITINDIIVTPPVGSIGPATSQVDFDFKIWTDNNNPNIMPVIPRMIPLTNFNIGPAFSLNFDPGSNVDLLVEIDLPVRFSISDAAGSLSTPTLLVRRKCWSMREFLTFPAR